MFGQPPGGSAQHIVESGEFHVSLLLYSSEIIMQKKRVFCNCLHLGICIQRLYSKTDILQILSSSNF